MFSRRRPPKKFKPLEPFAAQVSQAEVALADIRNGDHVFIGTACAAPHTLLQALDRLPRVRSHYQVWPGANHGGTQLYAGMQAARVGLDWDDAAR